MATVDGLTKVRMLQIESASIVAARIVADELILTTFGGLDVNVGSVRGAAGPLPSAPELNSAILAATSGLFAPLDSVTVVQSGVFATKANPAFSGTPTGITKSHVGLSNVDNTADSAKPVSTAQAAAIAAKVVNVPITFSFADPLVTSVDATAKRWYNDTGRTLTISKVRITVVTAPTGLAILVDVNKNGTTIFTTQANRPSIAISGFTGVSGVPNVTTVADGEYLTVNCDAKGSTIAGAGLSATVVMY